MRLSLGHMSGQPAAGSVGQIDANYGRILTALVAEPFPGGTN
jgi:hypothetical protein